MGFRDASPSFCFFQALEKAKWASETFRRHFAFSSAWKKQNELPRRSASFRFFQALEKAKWASETLRRHFAFSRRWKKQNGPPRRSAVILLFPAPGKSKMSFRDASPSLRRRFALAPLSAMNKKQTNKQTNDTADATTTQARRCRHT